MCDRDLCMLNVELIGTKFIQMDQPKFCHPNLFCWLFKCIMDELILESVTVGICNRPGINNVNCRRYDSGD